MTRSRSFLVACAVVVAIAARIPRLRYPLSPDEAGFLLVGSGWSSGGDRLYGDHWVDRPPLLITLFRLAEATGGMLSLRILGLAATGLAVWLASRLARSLVGDRAAVPAAATAALLFSTPVVANGRVDGELLATPFVLAGMWAAVSALDPRLGIWSAGARAAASGAAGVAAVGVKQNFVDVVLFVAVAGLAAVVQRHLPWRQAWVLIGGFLAGAVAMAVALLLWSWSHGTSPAELYEALYPFRIEAAQAINRDSPTVSERRVELRWAALLGGAVPLTVASAGLIWRRPRPTTWALFAVIIYAGFSVAAGGSAWLHYLVQPAGPVAVASAVALVTYGRGGRVLVRVVLAVVLIAAIVAAWVEREEPVPDQRARIGAAIADVARPDDSIVVFPFGANTAYASGLDTPYPYLWLLPAVVRDTDLRLLRATIDGAGAPTWAVLSARPGRWPGYGFTGPTDVFEERYRPVAELCGRPVYLLRGVTRETPRDPCA